MDNLGGYSFSLWRKHLPTKPAKKKGEKIFLTNKHIKEGLELIEEKWNDETTTNIYKLLVYSGMRLEHAVRMLEEFNRSKLIVENDVAMYPLDSVGKGNKKVYFAFMPEDFAKELEPVSDGIKYNAIKSRLTPRVWKPSVDIPVSPVRIRAWFQNFAIEHGQKTEAIKVYCGTLPNNCWGSSLLQPQEAG